jgi:putative glutamine amidotransferase
MAGERPPVIGITCSQFRTGQKSSPVRLGQNRSYVRAIVEAGAAPLLIPSLMDKTLLRALFGVLDGLLLSGGVDVDPAHYGEAAHPDLGQVDAERDETELALTCWAIEQDLPLLAICRGIQVLNVALGGSLYQDIQAQIPGAARHNWSPGYPRNHLPHPVVVSSETILAGILGTTFLPVNSLHHQSVKEVAPALTVVARAPDQVVEAVEVVAHPFAIGVQWHPEELIASDVRAQRLFDALVQACRE